MTARCALAVMAIPQFVGAALVLFASSCEGNEWEVFSIWSRRRDLNTRLLRPEELWKCGFYYKWLFIAVSAPWKNLFGGLVSVVSVCSKAVYGQICGQEGNGIQKQKCTTTAPDIIIS